ncbi:MAG TPA: hypothetical protein VK034_20795 [Enhygromyxa sp.]|nr:hypothetical protein [Enhygromyxa sp.]
MRLFSVALALALLAACSKSPDNPPVSSPDPVSDDKPDVEPDVDNGGVERPGLTAQECEAQGGTVVGDIGDGAIHRPDYRCPDSGEAPIGTIVADPEGPVAIEGSVCCK